MLDEALDLHAETLESLEGIDITYASGSSTFDAVAVLAQRRLDEELVNSRAIVSTKLLDVLIRPKWFSDNSIASPKPDDLITTTDGRRLQVHSHGDQPCFVWADPKHISFIRIHVIELKPIEV
ncbi:MAG: hypothetical protein ACTHK7_01920 [Aureliella sp.]